MSRDYFLKIHQHPEGERIVAVCDKEILGKKLTHNGVVLHIKERFYGQLECDLDDVLQELEQSNSYNVMGKKICEALIDKDMINPQTVLWIDHKDDKIGHAIVVR